MNELERYIDCRRRYTAGSTVDITAASVSYLRGLMSDRLVILVANDKQLTERASNLFTDVLYTDNVEAPYSSLQIVRGEIELDTLLEKGVLLSHSRSLVSIPDVSKVQWGKIDGTHPDSLVSMVSYMRHKHYEKKLVTKLIVGISDCEKEDVELHPTVTNCQYFISEDDNGNLIIVNMFDLPIVT